jgi:hypothetical protein
VNSCCFFLKQLFFGCSVGCFFFILFWCVVVANSFFHLTVFLILVDVVNSSRPKSRNDPFPHHDGVF